MTSATTRSAKLAVVPAQLSTAVRSAFTQCYAEWHAALAGIDTLNFGNDCTDKEAHAANDRLIAAEWGLIMTPSKSVCDMREKALATQSIMLRSVIDGEPTDNRHLVMLSSLVADIVRGVE